METVIKAIEIFAFITGVAYIILEVMQRNFMWVIGIATGLACSFSFGVQHIWGQMGLNAYYVVISIIGLIQWRKDSALLDASAPEISDSTIHLNRIDRKTLILSAVILLVGSAVLIWLLHLLGGSETILDAVVVVMGAIATWWLAKSYPQQWLIWLVADSTLTLICIHSRLWWMAGLYLAYALSSLYGWFHWTSKGRYLD